MQCGLSTACFFPMETTRALEEICNTEVKLVELFFNTFCELEDGYVDRLQLILRQNHMKVSAVHPFTSMMEPFFFSSPYLSRQEDGMQLYRRYFEVCRALEAPILVFHGQYQNTNYPFEQYCKNYDTLRQLGKNYGVSLCQENVARCKCGFSENIRKLREWTDDRAEFVLDLKQERRAENNLDEMFLAMNGKIRHVHISDFSQDYDCLPPGEGKENWPEIVNRLRQQPCDSMVVELYRDGFQDTMQLVNAAAVVNACLKP